MTAKNIPQDIFVNLPVKRSVLFKEFKILNGGNDFLVGNFYFLAPRFMQQNQSVPCLGLEIQKLADLLIVVPVAQDALIACMLEAFFKIIKRNLFAENFSGMRNRIILKLQVI